MLYFMSKEVSDKVVIVLLVLAFVFAVGGTFIIYDSVNDYKESKVQLSGTGAATGMVSLEVVDENNYLEGGDSIENIE